MRKQARFAYGVSCVVGTAAVATLVCLAIPRQAAALTTFHAAQPVSAWATGDTCIYDAYGFCDQDGAPAAATDGDGAVVVAWNSLVDLSGVSGTSDWRMLFVRSVDGGRTWSLPAYLDAGIGDTAGGPVPALVADSGGNFVAVWRSPDLMGPNPGVAIVRSTDGGQTWSPVAAAPGFAGSYSFTVGSNAGTGTMVMTGNKTVQRSVDGGATWTDLYTLDEGGFWNEFHLANDGANTWMIVDASSGSTRVSVSLDDGATWSAFSTPFAGGTKPGIATDGAGTWYLATVLSSYPSYDDLLYFSRSTDAGATWSAPVVLNMPSNGYDAPRFLVHGGGRLEMILSGRVDGAAGKDIDLTTYASYDDGETWSRVRAVTGTARLSLANTPGSGGDTSSVILDTGDSTLVVWNSFESLRFDLGEGVDLGYDPDILFAIGTERCDELPRNDCRALGAQGSTSLKVKHSPAGSDKLKWSWKRGSATTAEEFGDPTTDTDYTLCLYGADAAPMRLLSEQHMDTDGICRYENCWETKSSGYVYADRSGFNGGVRLLSLKPGEDGRTSISAQGSGPSLGFPAIPIAGLTEMRLQLVKESSGLCWESVLDQIESNTDRTLTLEGH